jgi:hypothetical protein
VVLDGLFVLGRHNCHNESEELHGEGIRNKGGIEGVRSEENFCKSAGSKGNAGRISAGGAFYTALGTIGAELGTGRAASQNGRPIIISMEYKGQS